MRRRGRRECRGSRVVQRRAKEVVRMRLMGSQRVSERRDR